ncbi:hypothetical protein BLNAU_24098 [Blattamonas nauphoetae]|uniref:Uncharacterized protein n=1 Tax=Blattamonas nauphoetae TaxID=2049346 RepID=A0ABQ9WNE7_9EUKA|nr:hypothetical protein BLNAU_24098 [Blattamonas nauphoetae]
MLEAEVSTVQEGGIFDVKARLVKGLSQRLYHKHAITCTTLADCLNTIMLNGESAEDYFNQPEDDTWVCGNKAETKKTRQKANHTRPVQRDLTEFVEWMSKFLNETEPLFNTNTAESNKRVNIQFNANDWSKGCHQTQYLRYGHLPSICSEGLTSKPLFCQLTGKYWMVLPQFNTVEPADNMFE